jgi:hypothetical protein
MTRFFDFLDKHKFGILAAIVTYIALFMYFQVQTYERSYAISAWDDKATLIKDEEKEIEIKPENIEQSVEIKMNGEVKSISRDMNDKREKSMKNWDQNKISKEIEQKIKNEEQQYKKESGGDAKREQILRDLEETKKNNKSSTTTKNNTQVSGGNTSYAGNVMVDWELESRDPHQNNNWHVRNPGYTCGDRVNGVVYIKIKVDQSGKVSNATYVESNSSNATGCMIQQAKKYALMSRFSYSGSASNSQEGKIIYTFVGQ